MCPFQKSALSLVLVFTISTTSFGQSTFNIKWGTHHALDGILLGTNYLTTDSNFSTAKAVTILKSLDADGTLGS